MCKLEEVQSIPCIVVAGNVLSRLVPPELGGGPSGTNLVLIAEQIITTAQSTATNEALAISTTLAPNVYTQSQWW